jgi:hypothetical protein
MTWQKFSGHGVLPFPFTTPTVCTRSLVEALKEPPKKPWWSFLFDSI